MDRIFSGDGDVDIVGVVGSTSGSKDDKKDDNKNSETAEKVNTGIIHTGRGNVYINNKRR